MLTLGSRCSFALVLVVVGAAAAGAQGEGIDSIMYRSPDVSPPTVVNVFADTLKPAWLTALARPEAGYKVRAAEGIADAHGRGMKGLDSTVPDLVRELERAAAPAAVQLGVAQTLVALDAKAAAPPLLARLATGDMDYREIVEPALAKWKHRPAAATWQARLKEPPTRRGAVLAIRGLTALQDATAVPRLVEIAAAADGPMPVRLEAAHALGELRRSGSEADAKRIADAGAVTARLVAATLLRHHDGGDAIRLLQTFAKDAEPAVAARAFARLIELDPQHVAPVLDVGLTNRDAAVRLLAVAALAREPSAANLRRLADRMADEHPAVRTKSRVLLAQLAAKAELKPAVIQEATRVLAAKDWGGLQQAALLVAHLDHKPATDRLLKLLHHDRGEVFVTAAWALRALAVPATHDAAFRAFRDRTAFYKQNMKELTSRTAQGIDEQLGQLAQFLGQGRYRPADATFRALLPPNTGGVETRAAAAWALGLIHEGQTGLGFEGALEGRLNATRPFDVEATQVRQMAAVTLGRVKAAGALKSLRDHGASGRPTADPVNNACVWAIAHIAGTPPPPPGTAEQRIANFFLVPLDAP